MQEWDRYTCKNFFRDLIYPLLIIKLSKEEREIGRVIESLAREILVKSVQSALSDLLTTSAKHGTFSRPSTKRGLILRSGIRV